MYVKILQTCALIQFFDQLLMTTADEGAKELLLRLVPWCKRVEGLARGGVYRPSRQVMVEIQTNKQTTLQTKKKKTKKQKTNNQTYKQINIQKT